MPDYAEPNQLVCDKCGMPVTRAWRDRGYAHATLGTCGKRPKAITYAEYKRRQKERARV